MIKLFRKKDTETDEYYIDRIEYPDGSEVIFDFEEEEIDMSKMQEFVGEEVVIYSKKEIVFDGILSDYEKENDGVDSIVVDMV